MRRVPIWILLILGGLAALAGLAWCGWLLAPHWHKVVEVACVILALVLWFALLGFVAWLEERHPLAYKILGYYILFPLCLADVAYCEWLWWTHRWPSAAAAHSIAGGTAAIVVAVLMLRKRSKA